MFYVDENGGTVGTNDSASVLALSFSTDEIYRGGDTNRCLSDDLDTIETNITALQTGKANTTHTHSDYMSEADAADAFALINHTHTGYMTEADATDAFALINHTHSEYLSASHTHPDLETLIEALDTEKADVGHTHAQSEITGLSDRLDGIEAAVETLEGLVADSDSTVQPMLTLSMHLGKLDNNSGAELASSTRICSDPFAIQNGKSYWQVNTNEVNMYVLVYDADEVFLSYLGNFASGAEIAVNVTGAAYMRLGSLLGNYDLENEYVIYDVDPTSSGDSATVDAYTKAEADARFAAISHTHDYAASDHTHSELHTHANQTVLDGITAAKVSAWDSASVGSVDAYTKTESDARYALSTHTHSDYMSEDDAVDAFAPITHSHAGYASSNHTHSYNDLTDTPSTTTYVHPDTHPASMITGLASVATSGLYSDLSGKPTSLPANGGDADTLGGNYPSAFAAASHTHSNYLPLTGGSTTGDVNVGGILRVNNQQSIFDSGTMITLSTNNRQTMIAGSQVYSKTTITVSSDERLKENIEYADPAACADFINDLEIKTFNYIGDDKPCIGVVAQDLQGTGFEDYFVFEQPGEEGYLAVKAADLVFPLIATVQKLSAEVEYLKTKI